MTKRTTISAPTLYLLIEREFRAKKPSACRHCYVSMPFRVDVAGDDSANWEIVPPSQCDMGCEAVLEEIVAHFQEAYRLSGGDE